MFENIYWLFAAEICTNLFATFHVNENESMVATLVAKAHRLSRQVLSVSCYRVIVSYRHGAARSPYLPAQTNPYNHSRLTSSSSWQIHVTCILYPVTRALLLP